MRAPVAASSGSGVGIAIGIVAAVVVLFVLGGIALALAVRAGTPSSEAPAAVTVPPVEVATATPTVTATATAVPTATATATTTATVPPTTTATIAKPVPFPTTKPTVVVPPPFPPQPRAFDRVSAFTQVNAVADRLQTCKTSSDLPSGSNVVTLVFPSTGRLEQVIYSPGPLNDPRLTGCITARFLAVRVAPFEGATERISREITIR